MRGWGAGAVSNAYWATAPEDALLWLRPLAEAGLSDLLLSEDAHHWSGEGTLVRNAAAAAAELGINTGTIVIRDAPDSVEASPSAKGATIKGGAVRFRGRAATLTDGLPGRPWNELDTCPHEELISPKRVHIDPFGYVHLCQGLAIGNLFSTPLAALLARYEPERHPICGRLLSGGPAALAREYALPHAESYVDECHLCYEMRALLRSRFPEYLAPDQMYGVVG